MNILTDVQFALAIFGSVVVMTVFFSRLPWFATFAIFLVAMGAWVFVAAFVEAYEESRRANRGE